ncbi:MAG TPA: carboxypeptidase regulatory-like domain-containing protein, partial [Longimicrobium sp.]|nr:carboxypeptidase regulatory-like domain-containing protein [Longimicrobium sp.]
RLVDEGGRPVAGAFVSLLDSAGTRVARGLSGEDGRYTLRAAAPGAYRVRAERIGHATSGSPVLRLGAEETVDFDLRSSSAPIVLEGIAGRGRSRCTVRPGAGVPAATLWTEARKALDAVVWSGSGAYSFTFVEYQNDVELGAMRVHRGRHQRVSGLSRGVWNTSDPAALPRQGYRRQRADGVWYIAPDAAVLLSEGFQDTHCFSAVRGDGDNQGLVGLAFEPQGRRRLVDVEGTLWIDVASAELRWLEYRYRHLPEAEDHPVVGGRLDFARLPNGAWIVKRWRIRMPLFDVNVLEASSHPSGWNRKPRVTAMHEAGGHVARVVDGRGRTVLVGDAGSVEGTVTSGPGGRPLAGARVRLTGTQHRAASGDDGSFRIDDLADGRYFLTFNHPVLDSMRASHQPVEVLVKTGAPARVALEGPTRDGALAAGCAADASSGIVVGTVRNRSTDVPLAGAEVRLRWGAEGSANVETDAEGRYRFCAAPLGVPLRLTATFLDVPVDAPAFTLADRAPQRRDFRLTVVSQSVRVGGERMEVTGDAPVRVVGTVRDVSGAPIAGVVVRFGTGLAERTTDRAGRFSLTRVPQGSYVVELVDVKRGTQRQPIAVGGGGEMTIDFTMTSPAESEEEAPPPTERPPVPERPRAR